MRLMLLICAVALLPAIAFARWHGTFLTPQEGNIPAPVETVDEPATEAVMPVVVLAQTASGEPATQPSNEGADDSEEAPEIRAEQPVVSSPSDLLIEPSTSPAQKSAGVTQYSPSRKCHHRLRRIRKCGQRFSCLRRGHRRCGHFR
jgi:hypothetical protein